ICKGRCSHGQPTLARLPGRHMKAPLPVSLIVIFPTSSRRTARSNGTAKFIKTNAARSSWPQLERARSASCLVLIFYVGTLIGEHQRVRESHPGPGEQNTAWIPCVG